MQFKKILLPFLILLLVSSNLTAKTNETNIIDPLVTTQPSETAKYIPNKFEPAPYSPKSFFREKGGYYFLTGKFDIDLNITEPAILISFTQYPYRIYINGKPFYHWGSGKDSKTMSNFNSTALSLNNYDIKNSGNDILVQFYTNGGSIPIPKIIFGEYDELFNKAFIDSLFSHYFIIAIVITILFGAIIFTGHFFVSGKKEREILYFVLASFFFATCHLDILLNSQYFPELAFFKLSRFSYFLVAAFLLLFIQSCSGLWQKYKKLFWIPIYIAVLAGVSFLFLPNKYQVHRVFSVLEWLILIPELATLFIMYLINIKKHPTINSYLLFAGFFILTLATLRDVYMSINNMEIAIRLNSYGFFVQIVTMAFVITMRKKQQYEETVTLKNGLEIANAQIKLEAEKREDFINSIVSELRIPMNGLEERIIEVDKESNSTRNSISGAFRQVRITLSNIFDYVAIREDSFRVQEHLFNLHQLLEDTKTFYSESAGKKGLSLLLDYNKTTVPKKIIADREHLVQIIDNLLNNAINYTEKGGVSCTVDLDESKNLLFSIIDTGKGFDTSSIKIIKKEFINSYDSSYLEKHSRVGLGLTITYIIVEKMGGKLDIESRKNSGTTITVTLPIKLNENRKNNVFGKILIAEDNRVNTLILTKLLTKCGYEYRTTKNGLEAVAEMKANQYDCILMDIEMPLMDGIEATKKIREFNTDIPIIAVTANGKYDDCMDAGMNDYMLKPLNFAFLKDTIQKHLLGIAES